jgi:16S rRNA (guanine(966)-N(2))-methyltransferase RsmD
MKTKITTKIIGGKHKGKILNLPSLDTTRSSKAVLKESFFNVLQFDIIDTIFVEAFGGSGSIGLESISRGAGHCYFIEKDKNSYKTLQENCKLVDVDATTTIYGDTFEKLPNLIASLKNKDEDIVLYIDPPFDFREGMEDIYEKTFDLIRTIENDNVFLVTFEHMTGLELPEVLGKFKKFKYKKFGKSSLTYYKL